MALDALANRLASVGTGIGGVRRHVGCGFLSRVDWPAHYRESGWQRAILVGLGDPSIGIDQSRILALRRRSVDSAP